MRTAPTFFICEGMYGEPDKEKKAVEYKHMTFKEAGRLAKEAEVKELWLTHYSLSYAAGRIYGQRTEYFPNAWPGKDGKSVDLTFEED